MAVRTRYNVRIGTGGTPYTKIINDGTDPLIVGKPSDYVIDDAGVATITLVATTPSYEHGIYPAPTNFTAVRAGDYLSCQLDWDAVAGATSYEIFRSPNYTSQMALIQTTASLTYNDTGLTAAQPYVYSIRAINTTNGVEGIRTLPVYSPSINETH